MIRNVRDDDAGRVRRWRELLNSERDAATLYARIANAETGERKNIFEELAAVERQHAAHWEQKIREAGATVPPPGGLGNCQSRTRPATHCSSCDECTVDSTTFDAETAPLPEMRNFTDVLPCSFGFFVSSSS